jgi:hypothetical protein
MNASRIWTAGAVLLIGGILALGWLLGAAPLLAQAAAADTERISAEAQTRTQRAALEVMKVDFGRLEEIQTELRDLQTSIPTEERIDAFAAAAEAVATRNGVLLTSVVAPEMPFGSSAAAPVTTAGTGGAVTTTPAGTVYAIPVTLGIEGQDVGLFATLRDLQTLTRLFLVTSITVNGYSSTGTPPSATVSGYIFILTDRPLAATPEEAATADLGPGTTYQVPDLEGALPGGLGSDPTPAPTGTPAPTPTPTPTGTPSG